MVVVVVRDRDRDRAHARARARRVAAPEHADGRLAVRHEDDLAHGADPLVVLQLFAAVVTFGSVACHLDDHDGVRERETVAFVALLLTADDRYVGIRVEAGGDHEPARRRSRRRMAYLGAGPPARQ